MKWSQEGTWESHVENDVTNKKAKRVTRSLGTFFPACWEGTKNLYTGGAPSMVPEDIFYEFLKGQQVLLERLLTPSIASHNSLI